MDVKKLEWKDINDGVMTTRIIQAKTGKPVTITLHPIAEGILDKQAAKVQGGQDNNKFVFALPTANGANKVLSGWMENAGIEKHIT